MNPKNTTQQKMNDPAAAIPPINQLLQDADHIDIKSFVGDVSLREFLAGMFSYYPGWLRFLYQIRWGFVRLLGMKQHGVPQMRTVKPEEIAMEPGQRAAFFTVKAAAENHFFLAGETESHLTAHLAVVREDPQAAESRFLVVTIVHYHRWTGPLYFNVIRPFHHLVVRQMGLAGIQFKGVS